MDDARVYVSLLAPVLTDDAPPPVPPAVAPPKTPVVIALNRQTGVTAWMAPLESQWPPVAGPGVVYVAAGSEVSALDAGTGRSRWTLTLPAAPRAPMLLRGSLLFVLTAPDDLVAIRVDTQAIVWRRSISEQGAVQMNADESAVYVATASGRVMRVLAADGSIDWQVTLDGELSEPAVTPTRVFVGSKTNSFWALEADSGDIDWWWPGIRFGGDVIGAAVDRDSVFVATADNSLRTLDIRNGNQRWKRAITRPMAPPVFFGGIVTAIGLAPTLATFNAVTGVPTPAVPPTAHEWSAPSGSQLQGRPMIDPALQPFGVAVVVLLRDGRIIGLRPVGMKFPGPLPVPLTELPGRPLSPETFPGPQGTLPPR